MSIAPDDHAKPWETTRRDEPFEWVTLFPDAAVESLARGDCIREMRSARVSRLRGRVGPPEATC